MDAKAKSFRKRSRAENRGRTREGRRYSHELRLEALAYLKRRKRGGASLEQAASELGVSSLSLSRWSRDVDDRGSLVPVELVRQEQAAAGARVLTLVTPGGYRIEGLSEEFLLGLVERLG